MSIQQGSRLEVSGATLQLEQLTMEPSTTLSIQGSSNNITVLNTTSFNGATLAFPNLTDAAVSQLRLEGSFSSQCTIF